MELTTFTDYSLRVLMYLAREENRQSSIDELASYYGISRHHLAKITRHLASGGYLETSRGKNGGVSLAKDPKDINLAEIVLFTEPHMNMVECFAPGKNGCCLDKCCRLKGILFGARSQFVSYLERYSLADACRGSWPNEAVSTRPTALSR